MIAVCPKCKQEIELPIESISGKVRCPYCESKFVVELRLVDVNAPAKEDQSMTIPEIVVVTTGREYEECIDRMLKANGYNSTLTPESCDQGVDVVVHLANTKIAIQCKLYSTSVGNDAVQEVVAGSKYYHCERACVVSNAEFTPSAIKLASANNVRLLHHADLLKFLSELVPNASSQVTEDFEKTGECAVLVERAGQGYEDARVKLRDYYNTQVLKYVNTDLIVASDYYIKACCLGHLESLFAFGNYNNNKEGAGGTLADNDPYKMVLDDLFCDMESFAPGKFDEVRVEYWWAYTNTMAETASKLPKGRQQDTMVKKLPFVRECDVTGRPLPKQLFYLGWCYMCGWGCALNDDIAAYYLKCAFDQGYRFAGEVLTEVNGSFEEGEKIVNSKARRILCPNCGVVVSTDSQFCWSCDAPVPGWTGKKLNFD